MTIYLITPFFTWLITGCTKFAINCLKEKRLAFDLIGYGGMPSNHSAIVSSITALVAFEEGLNSPAFGVALTFTFIVLLDANSLRNQVGKQAQAINKLIQNNAVEIQPLRERIGHSRLEILAGLVTGVLCATLLHFAFILFGHA